MLSTYRERLLHALRQFIHYLHEQGAQTGILFPARKEPVILPEHEALLGEFGTFLLKHRGVKPNTIKIYRDHAWRLCRFASERGLKDWEALTPRVLYDYLAVEAKRLGHLCSGNRVTALRSFFRFLYVKGFTSKDAGAWLLRTPNWRLGRVVRRVTLSELTAVFRDVRGPSLSDLRDRLILIFLTVYGLRIGDIARLAFEDVRWREGVLLVRQRKTGHPLSLPLHPAVGKVLLEYVQRARPRGTPYREILLTWRNPRPYGTGSSLGATLRKRFERLGLKIHPHMFRHMVASRLLNNGCPPACIQILLGHESPRSTEVYAKVDLVHLSEVAQNNGANL